MGIMGFYGDCFGIIHPAQMKNLTENPMQHRMETGCIKGFGNPTP